MFIIDIIDIITIIRIVVCFQCRYQCAFEGLGSSVSHSRCWEQKQNPSIPDSIRRHNKGAIIDTRRPNHDHVQAMTAVEGFCGKWIAVNTLDALVFSMTQHQTVIQSKMTLALGWFLEFQGPEESSHLKNNMYNKYKTYNTFCIKNYIMLIFYNIVAPVYRTRTGVNMIHRVGPDR